jgi:uncharacterized protein YcfJ
MIRKKILFAVIIGGALVAVVGALAIRQTRNYTASQANTSASPTQANNQAQSTADPSAVEKAPDTASTKVASNGASTRRNSSRSVYYSSRRTFWEKHRDKLTVAAGAGTGALVGGLIGGKKGAGVGILAGGAGSALYTYKLRHRRHRY